MGEVITLRDDIWSDAVSDYAEECRKGRERADRMVQQMSNDAALHPQFIRAMSDIINSGIFGGAEIGFCQRLLEYAVAGYEVNGRQ